MTGSTESTAMLVAKLAPPASVTVASVIGLQVSELVLWATLVYTVLMILHKLCVMYKDASAWWKS
jgi:hypothetical protein